ncbi:MAG: hypothetical protein WAW26_23830, partial [Anaerolineae bacterium]
MTRSALPQAQVNIAVGLLCRRPEIGDRRLDTGWRWAVIRRPFAGRRLEGKGSLVCPGSSGQALLAAALPNIPCSRPGRIWA